MAIKGLTDQQARFPEIGVLRKGDVQPDKGPGKDLTYFRFDTSDDNARQMFEAAYGKEPREIHCYLPFETVEENFHTSKEEWTAGALQHRCDGDTCEVWLQKDGTYSREPVPCPGGCKPVGRLKLIIPEIKRLAYVTLLTTSLWDIMNLSQRLAAYEMFMGRLNGLRFILSRRPEMISTPEVIYDKKSPDYGKPTGKRVRREKWLVFINGDPEWENKILDRMSQAVLPEGITEFNALEAPDDSDYEVDMSTGEIIEPEAPAPNKAIARPKKQKKSDNPPSNGGKIGGDATSQFWYHVRLNKIDPEAARSVADECGGDFEKALNVLMGATDMTPPDNDPRQDKLAEWEAEEAKQGAFDTE